MFELFNFNAVFANDASWNRSSCLFPFLPFPISAVIRYSFSFDKEKKNSLCPWISRRTWHWFLMLQYVHLIYDSPLLDGTAEINLTGFYTNVHITKDIRYLTIYLDAHCKARAFSRKWKHFSSIQKRIKGSSFPNFSWQCWLNHTN